jgi:hypothetical protein
MVFAPPEQRLDNRPGQRRIREGRAVLACGQGKEEWHSAGAVHIQWQAVLFTLWAFWIFGHDGLWPFP